MLHRLYEWYGKRVVLSVAAVILLLLTVGVFLLVTRLSQTAGEESAAPTTFVTVQKVSDIIKESFFSTVGVVEAISEARLQTQSSGQVTSVNVEIGDRVAIGQILASLENRSEAAALLQAQGSYEAALAGAESSVIGVEGASNLLRSTKISAVNAYQNAFVTVDNVIHNVVDDLFTMNGANAVGFKLDAQGQATQLNAERTALGATLTSWSLHKKTASVENISSLLDDTRRDVLRIALFVEEINKYAVEQDVSDSYTQIEKDDLTNLLYASSLTLQQTLQSIEATASAIDGAKKTLQQAEIASKGETLSVANAQVKIALGTLHSAQANYEKTIVRSPITGEVNALYIKEGEYVSAFSPAAIVANNNGLQIRTSVNQADATQLTVGDEVVIEKSEKGTVRAIAPATDPTTGKVAIKIDVEVPSNLSNGSTVSLEFKKQTDPDVELIIIPLSSLKITSTGPIAFSVGNDNTLIPISVTIGTIRGESVEITGGLEKSSLIVTDARGLKAGQKVEVIK